MARDRTIKILRTTKANLETQKTGSGLLVGEPYLITDEARLAVGTAVNDYSEMAKKVELPAAASTTVAGIVEIATGSEVDTGTDDGRAISPKALADQTVLFKKTGGALSGALNEAKGTDIASATTTDIGAATGNYVVVTGTTTITGLGTVQAGTRRIVNFSGALILTHNATSLILPTVANITTAAGDTATFISLGSGNWVCTNYQRKSGITLDSIVVLTDEATPALDASKGNLFTLSATGNRTIAVPTNATAGQKIIIRHYASGGARTLALNTGTNGFRFGSDITALTATASGKYDYIGCIWNAASSTWDVVSVVKGY